jgi:molecular chaperone DnaK
MELANAGKTIMIGGRAIPPPKAFVQEVTFHSVGCCVVDQNKDLRNAVILPKATPIPTSKTDRFSLEHEGQTEARIEILQGEEGQPKDECLSIGQIVLSNLPPEHQRSKRIEVTYRIDKNGMIHAAGRDLVSGKQVEVQVDYHKQVKPAA